MRYFLVSDIHGNLEALQAVMEDMNRNYKPSFSKKGKDRLGNLGDIIGYIPNPNEVMDIVFPIASFNLIGNHDMAVSSNEYQSFNRDALWAMEWTLKTLTEPNRKRLESLFESERYTYSPDGLIFSHSNPGYPRNMSEYIQSKDDAFNLFFGHGGFARKIAFAGHIHAPQIYISNRNLAKVKSTKVMNIIREKKIDFMDPLKTPVERVVKSFNLKDAFSSLVVIPSVGQPRDRCPLSGYAVFDTDTKVVDLVRVPYDIPKTQEKMRRLNFPEHLIHRISIGS